VHLKYVKILLNLLFLKVKTVIGSISLIFWSHEAFQYIMLSLHSYLSVIQKEKSVSFILLTFISKRE